MASQKADISRKHIKEPLEDVDPEDVQVSDVEGFGKSKVECICPYCGKMHIMKMQWIGRGVPRKFCQSCRDRENPSR
jgi:transposase-like protein